MVNSKRVYAKEDLPGPRLCGEPLLSHAAIWGAPKLASSLGPVPVGSLPLCSQSWCMQILVCALQDWNLCFLLSSAATAKSCQLCPTLCDPIDGSPPGSPVPGILQARTLEWGAISFSNAWKWKVKVKSLSCVRLLATPWTAAYQAPLSTGFSRQEYWSGSPVAYNQIPLAIDTRFPGDSQSLCWIPRLEGLTWGSEPSQKYENFFGIIVLQSVGHSPGGYGIWIFCDCAPPTILLWLFLCLWTCIIFFWWVPVVNSCSTASCSFCALAGGKRTHPATQPSGTRSPPWMKLMAAPGCGILQRSASSPWYLLPLSFMFPLPIIRVRSQCGSDGGIQNVLWKGVAYTSKGLLDNINLY